MQTICSSLVRWCMIGQLSVRPSRCSSTLFPPLYDEGEPASYESVLKPVMYEMGVYIIKLDNLL